MASRVDGAGSGPALYVGLWTTGPDYLLAAYIRRAEGAGAPVELPRSRQPIRSVTYFPSPDSPAGTLGLLASTEDGIALASLGWDHAVLSRQLMPHRQ